MVGNSSFVLSSRSTGILIIMKAHDSQDQLNSVEERRHDEQSVILIIERSEMRFLGGYMAVEEVGT